MPSVETSDGIDLHWMSEGEGPTILLVHGFASDLERNWRATSWTRFLRRLGLRVVAFDLRGHGKSGKPRDPVAYAVERLIGDLHAVLDATGTEAAVWMGYSMGAQILLHAASRDATRCGALVLGGIGQFFFPSLGAPDRDVSIVADVLEADDPSSFPEGALVYRRFAEQSGGDRKALAACWRREREDPGPAALGRIDLPTLVVAGSADDMAGDPLPLVGALGNAEAAILEGRNHMSAVGVREHREAVEAFLSRLGIV